jgi:UDP-N-acetylglucosamine diphosphorylase/glucosamine-1-phosphate N-acetyltransferase
VYLYDDGKGLAPATDLRAAFDVRTGALTLVGRLAAAGEVQVIGAFVPDGLAAVTRERHTISVNPVLGRREPFLAVNARCPMVRGQDVGRLTQPGTALVHEATGEIMAACVNPEMVAALLAEDTSAFRLEKHGDDALSRPFSRPWHIRSHRDALIRSDLSLLLTTKALGADSPGPIQLVHAAPTATVHPSAIFDTEGGPVYLADHAVVRPGAILIGPCYVGPHSTVVERAIIRANTAIGPFCKVAGEISGTIFQGFSNKAHDGFLGDSWVGEWVNLGAGTTNSNLLNTYGEVIARATPGGPNERTGEQFLGAIIGDHVKTAICTRIMTGAVIHTGSMIATTTPAVGCIAPFSWCTDGGTRRYALNKFVETARAMMGRRGVKPSEAYVRRIQSLLEAAHPPASA